MGQDSLERLHEMPGDPALVRPSLVRVNHADAGPPKRVLVEAGFLGVEAAEAAHVVAEHRGRLPPVGSRAQLEERQELPPALRVQPACIVGELPDDAVAVLGGPCPDGLLLFRDREVLVPSPRSWSTMASAAVDGTASSASRRRSDGTERAWWSGYHLDRVARDVAALLDTLRAWSRRGVELHVVGRGRIEAETANGLLMTGIEGLLAEHYRRLISEKTRDALARLRAKGRRVSRFPPYGFRVAPEGGLVANPREQEVLVAIGALRASGRSLRAIARTLADRGILARSGRPFAPSTLWPLVRNRAVTDIAAGEVWAACARVDVSECPTARVTAYLETLLAGLDTECRYFGSTRGRRNSRAEGFPRQSFLAQGGGWLKLEQRQRRFAGLNLPHRESLVDRDRDRVDRGRATGQPTGNKQQEAAPPYPLSPRERAG